MNVLIFGEYSGVVRDAFLSNGHNAISCDLLPTDSPGPHIQGDGTYLLKMQWDLIIAHPPCKYLSNSGVHLLISKKKSEAYRMNRRLLMLDARKLFMTIWEADCPRICIENPISHKHAMLPEYAQTVQPYNFGHTTSKRTCFWLKGLPLLQDTHTHTLPKEQRTYDIMKLGPNNPNRAKIRSRTFDGIARAMADQWGGWDI